MAARTLTADLLPLNVPCILIYNHHYQGNRTRREELGIMSRRRKSMNRLLRICTLRSEQIDWVCQFCNAF